MEIVVVAIEASKVDELARTVTHDARLLAQEDLGPVEISVHWEDVEHLLALGVLLSFAGCDGCCELSSMTLELLDLLTMDATFVDALDAGLHLLR